MERMKGLMVLTMLSFAPATTGLADNFKAAERFNIVPTPQKIDLQNETHAVNQFKIVAPADLTLPQTAAEEINEKITALGGEALDVVDAFDGGPAIVIAPRDHAIASSIDAVKSLDVETLPDQGYVIEVVEIDGEPVVLGIGADPHGALYAAMTLRQLIVKSDDGISLTGAKVRDWPEFKTRCMTRPRSQPGGPPQWEGAGSAAETYFEENKDMIQWLARNKINMALIYGPGGPEGYIVEGQRLLTDYAEKYGIRARRKFGTAINQWITDEEWTECVTRKEARHCWTAFEAHNKNAEYLAENAEKGGVDFFCMHAVDSGGLATPEKWNERCDRCREHYGDDHTRAAAEQFMNYYNAFKERVPDGIFEAVVYPYHYQWTLDGFAEDPESFGESLPHIGWVRDVIGDVEKARRVVRDLKDYHSAIAKELPNDVLVTFREAGRREFDGVCELWKGHPVNIWFYWSRNHGWGGLWEPQARFCKTWARDEPRDVLDYEGSARSGVMTPVWAAGTAEYAWSFQQPDASAEFETTSRYYDTEGKNVTEYQQASLIPRIVNNMWHERIANAVLPLFQKNASFHYVADPDGASAKFFGEDWDNPYKYWEDVTEVVVPVAAELREIVAEIDAGKPLGLYGGNIQDEYGYQWLMWLYESANNAAIKAQIELAKYRAGEYMKQGNEAEARAIVEDMIEKLPAFMKIRKEVSERMDSDPVVRRRASKANPENRNACEAQMATYPIEEQKEALAAIVSGDEQAAAEDVQGTKVSFEEVTRSNQTVDYGFATIVNIRPLIVSSEGVSNAKASMSLSENGEVLGSIEYEIEELQGQWKPMRAADFDLGKVVEGDISIEVKLTSADGGFEEIYNFNMKPDGSIEAVE